MKKNKLKYYDLDIYSDTLDNGLRVFIVPFKNIKNTYVTFSTKFGSIDDEFIPIDSDEYYKCPLGVAHFLEHKVFETEEGLQPFTFYANNGAESNANTSKTKTTYLFSSSMNFKENLNFLLDFVQIPYFTDDNVAKEKGIIEQEIKMTNDNPYWRLYNKTIFNTFVNDPHKYDIGGTVDSIYKITTKDLYTCYNTFYHPSNMFVTITGNVNPNEALDIIKNNQSKKVFKPFKNIIKKHIDEPLDVYKREEVINYGIEVPKIGITVKIPKKDNNLHEFKTKINLLCSFIFGCTSLLIEEFRDNEYISDDIYYHIDCTNEYVIPYISFESKYYDIVIKRIKEYIMEYVVSEEELTRKKKTLISNMIYRSDNLYSINSKINNNILDYDDVVLDDYLIYDKISVNDLNSILKSIDISNSSLVIFK